MTWLDKMSDAEATAARRLIRALSLEGIEDADSLVQAGGRTREPIVARRVLEHGWNGSWTSCRRRSARPGDGWPLASRTSSQPAAPPCSTRCQVSWVLVALDSGADSPEPRLIPKLQKR